MNIEELRFNVNQTKIVLPTPRQAITPRIFANKHRAWASDVGFVLVEPHELEAAYQRISKIFANFVSNPTDTPTTDKVGRLLKCQFRDVGASIDIVMWVMQNVVQSGPFAVHRIRKLKGACKTIIGTYRRYKLYRASMVVTLLAKWDASEQQNRLLEKRVIIPDYLRRTPKDRWDGTTPVESVEDFDTDFYLKWVPEALKQKVVQMIYADRLKQWKDAFREWQKRNDKAMTAFKLERAQLLDAHEKRKLMGACGGELEVYATIDAAEARARASVPPKPEFSIRPYQITVDEMIQITFQLQRITHMTKVFDRLGAPESSSTEDAVSFALSRRLSVAPTGTLAHSPSLRAAKRSQSIAAGSASAPGATTGRRASRRAISPTPSMVPTEDEDESNPIAPWSNERLESVIIKTNALKIDKPSALKPQSPQRRGSAQSTTNRPASSTSHATSSSNTASMKPSISFCEPVKSARGGRRGSASPGALGSQKAHHKKMDLADGLERPFRSMPSIATQIPTLKFEDLSAKNEEAGGGLGPKPLGSGRRHTVAYSPRRVSVAETSTSAIIRVTDASPRSGSLSLPSLGGSGSYQITASTVMEMIGRTAAVKAPVTNFIAECLSARGERKDGASPVLPPEAASPKGKDTDEADEGEEIGSIPSTPSSKGSDNEEDEMPQKRETSSVARPSFLPSLTLTSASSALASSSGIAAVGSVKKSPVVNPLVTQKGSSGVSKKPGRRGSKLSVDTAAPIGVLPSLTVSLPTPAHHTHAAASSTSSIEHGSSTNVEITTLAMIMDPSLYPKPKSPGEDSTLGKRVSLELAKDEPEQEKTDEKEQLLESTFGTLDRIETASSFASSPGNGKPFGSFHFGCQFFEEELDRLPSTGGVGEDRLGGMFGTFQGKGAFSPMASLAQLHTPAPTHYRYPALPPCSILSGLEKPTTANSRFPPLSAPGTASSALSWSSTIASSGCISFSSSALLNRGGPLPTTPIRNLPSSQTRRCPRSTVDPFKKAEASKRKKSRPPLNPPRFDTLPTRPKPKVLPFVSKWRPPMLFQTRFGD